MFDQSEFVHQIYFTNFERKYSLYNSEWRNLFYTSRSTLAVIAASRVEFYSKGRLFQLQIEIA